MRTSRALVLGAIMGAAVVWLWGREIGEYLEKKTRGVRTKAADGVRAVEEKAGKVLDRTREDVSEAFRAGQEAIRPGTSG
jgi:hypothetical protein